MKQLLIVVIFLTLSIGIQTQHIHTEDERLKCEPVSFRYNTLRYWMNKHNFTMSPGGFLVKTVYRSSDTYPDAKLGNFEIETGSTTVHRYTAALEIKKAGHTVPMFKLTALAVYTIHHGGTAVFHTFNAQTKEYKRAELGFHKQKYVLIIEKDTWYVLEVQKHGKERFVLDGWTFMPYVTETSATWVFADRAEMLQLFPDHSEFIIEHTLAPGEIYVPQVGK